MEQSIQPPTVPFTREAVHRYLIERIAFEEKMRGDGDLTAALMRQSKISAYLHVRMSLLGIAYDLPHDAPLPDAPLPEQDHSDFPPPIHDDQITTKPAFMAPGIWPHVINDLAAQTKEYDRWLAANNPSRRPTWLKSILLFLTRRWKPKFPR